MNRALNLNNSYTKRELNGERQAGIKFSTEMHKKYLGKVMSFYFIVHLKRLNQCFTAVNESDHNFEGFQRSSLNLSGCVSAASESA